MPSFVNKAPRQRRRGGKRNLSGPLISSALLLCCIAGLFCPTQLALVGLGSLTQPLTLLGYAGGVCYVLLNIKRLVIDWPVALTAAYVGIALATTATNGQFTTLFLQTLASEALLCLLVQIALSKESVLFVRLSFYVMALYVTANAVFILANISAHPDGFYRSSGPDAMAGVWLLGHKNQLRNWIIPAIALSYLLDIVSKNTVTMRTLIITVIGIVSAYYSDSATTFIVLLIIGTLLFVVMVLKRHRTAILNPINGTIFSGALFFVCVFMRKIPVLGSFIEDLLGRDASFTGRTGIWDRAISGIGENPFGSGYFTTSRAILATDGGYIVNHAHNAYLDTTLKYGIFGLATFLGLIFYAVFSLVKQGDARIRAVLSACLVSFLICGVFGELFNNGFALVLYLCCYSASIGNTDADSAK